MKKKNAISCTKFSKKVVYTWSFCQVLEQEVLKYKLTLLPANMPGWRLSC